MSKFKVGDIVRRKFEDIDKDFYVSSGVPVTICEVDDCWLTFKGDQDRSWCEDFFELVEHSQENSTLTVEKALAFLMQEGYTVSISKK